MNKTTHKRWAAEVDGWDDTVIVSEATIVETEKQFRILGYHNSDCVQLSAAERMFNRAIGYREVFPKDAYPSGPGWCTQMGAIKGMVDKLRKEVKDAEASLRVRKQLLEDVEEQLRTNEYKVIRSEH